jgi:hypothetical protein
MRRIGQAITREHVPVSCKWEAICPIRRYTEAGLLDPKWRRRYCLGENWRQCVRYHMEERGEPHPDWMLPDGTLDESLKGM